MKRLILAISAFFFCFSRAEVKVEKVLETTSIKEYNQWVKKNRARYPGLRPVYIKSIMIRRVKEKKLHKKYYKICYYDKNGRITDVEEIKGNWVRVSPFFDMVEILESGPYYCAKTILKDKKGDVILIDSSGFYLEFTGTDLLFLNPPGEVPPGANPTIKIFDAARKLWVAEIHDSWFFDGCEVSSTRRYLACIMLKDNNVYTTNHLVFLDAKGRELWRKSYVDEPDPNKLPGLSAAIAPDASTIVAGHNNNVFVYDSTGKLLRSYSLPSSYPTKCGISDKGKYLLVATRNHIIKHNNETREEIWRKGILEGTPMKVVLSGDGRYGLIQFHPNIVYLIDENGDILKQWDLETAIHHPTAPGGKKIKVTHPVKARLEFHDDIIFIIHELNGEVFIKIWRIKEG